MRIVISVIGKDTVGIIASVSTILAQNNINILNINQNIVDGYFNMITIADMTNAKVDLQTIQTTLKNRGLEIGVEIKVQHESIFEAMHNI